MRWILECLQKEKVEIEGDDFREGLTAVVSVKVQEPQFEGQNENKTRKQRSYCSSKSKCF